MTRLRLVVASLALACAVVCPASAQVLRVQQDGGALSVASVLDCINGITCTCSSTSDGPECTINGGGFVSDVFNCASGDCADIVAGATDSLDFSAVDANAAGEGLILPQTTTCGGSGQASGSLCYQTTGDALCVWDGAAWDCQTLGVTDTDTNASTLCTGTTTYLDGEGNCDDISSVYAAAAHSHTGSTLSGIDISDDTNLAASGGVTLTGDTLSLSASPTPTPAPKQFLAGPTNGGPTPGAAVWRELDANDFPATISQLGQTIECTEFSTSMTCDATHGIDFNSGTSKAPLDLPRDTAANCASVTSEGRVCCATDSDLCGAGTGTVWRPFMPLPNLGATATPVATATAGGVTPTPAPTSTNLPTPAATSTAATVTPTPAPTATKKAGVDDRPVGMCWSEGAIGSSTAIYFTGGGSSAASQAAWTPARDFDVWVGKLCVKPQFDALQGQIDVALHTNARAGCRSTAEAGNANCGTAPVRQGASSVTIVAGTSWYDNDSQCSTGWVRVPAGTLYRYTESASGWHTPPGGGSAAVSATWMVCAATPF